MARILPCHKLRQAKRHQPGCTKTAKKWHLNNSTSFHHCVNISRCFTWLMPRDSFSTTSSRSSKCRRGAQFPTVVHGSKTLGPNYGPVPRPTTRRYARARERSAVGLCSRLSRINLQQGYLNSNTSWIHIRMDVSTAKRLQYATSSLGRLLSRRPVPWGWDWI